MGAGGEGGGRRGGRTGIITGQAALIHLDGWTWEEMDVKKSAAMAMRFPSIISGGGRFGGGDLPPDIAARFSFTESKKNYETELRELKEFFEDLAAKGMVRISPASRDHAQAEKWMSELAPVGLDGVVAKLGDAPYASGERTAMVKIKRLRTADCVVGGFRYAEKGGGIGSLLLGLQNEEGKLDHIGFTSSFTAEQRQELKKVVEPLIAPPGFTGKAPGGPSRWSTRRSDEWKPLKPKLVCEVRYDHFSGGRFRHGTKFLRWRPDKKPKQCTFEQVLPKSREQSL